MNRILKITGYNGLYDKDTFELTDSENLTVSIDLKDATSTIGAWKIEAKLNGAVLTEWLGSDMKLKIPASFLNNGGVGALKIKLTQYNESKTRVYNSGSYLMEDLIIQKTSRNEWTASAVISALQSTAKTQGEEILALKKKIKIITTALKALGSDYVNNLEGD